MLVLEPAGNQPLQQDHYLPTLGSFSLSLKRRTGLPSRLTASAIRENALRLEKGARDHVSATEKSGFDALCICATTLSALLLEMGALGLLRAIVIVGSGGYHCYR